MKKIICMFLLIGVILSISSCANINWQADKNVSCETNEYDNNKDSIEENHLKDGIYVRENVPIDERTPVRMTEYRIPHHLTYIDTVGMYHLIEIQSIYDASVCVKYAMVARIKKVGSKSYYKEYDDGTVLAYTVSQLEIKNNLSKTEGYKEGDIVNAVEYYAFAPETSDEIVHSVAALNSTLIYTSSNALSGLIQTNKEYIVLLYSNEYPYSEYISSFLSTSTENAKKDMLLPEAYWFVSGDIYPADPNAYLSAKNGLLKDLCIPVDKLYELWEYGYDFVFDEILNKEGIGQQTEDD